MQAKGMPAMDGASGQLRPRNEPTSNLIWLCTQHDNLPIERLDHRTGNAAPGFLQAGPPSMPKAFRLIGARGACRDADPARSLCRRWGAGPALPPQAAAPHEHSRPDRRRQTGSPARSPAISRVHPLVQRELTLATYLQAFRICSRSQSEKRCIRMQGPLDGVPALSKLCCVPIWPLRRIRSSHGHSGSRCVRPGP